MRRLIKRVLLSNVVSFSQSLFNSFKSRVIGNSGVVEADSCAVTTLSNLDSKNLLQSATFVLAPSGYKSGVIYSQVPSNGNGDLTVTRATTATRVNSAGLIESVASGVPQLDYSLGGCPNFLFEPQRTNLLKYSDQFDNAIWAKDTGCSVTPDTTISPDGTQNADTIIGCTGTGGWLVALNDIRCSVTGLSSSTQYYLSFYIKAITATTVKITLRDQSLGTTSSTVCPLTSSWQRFSVTRTTGAATTSLGILIDSADGTFSIWGAQLEQGAYPTSYIPTTSAAVTRNATSFARSNIYTNGLIGASGGTWFVEFKNNLSLTRDSANIGFGIKSNSDNNGIYFRNIGTTRLYLSTCVNGIGLLGQYQTTATNCKIIIKWDGTFLNAWENGLQVITNLSFTITNMELINGDFSLVPNYISQMALWNTPLSEAQCIALTS